MCKISVITVVFNAEDVIVQTLDSVFSQANINFEYIIINGASIDSTNRLINDYLELNTNEHVNFIYINEKDRGIYDAMNKGIQLSSSEFILFLNAGDIFYNSNVLSYFSGFFKGNDIIYGNTLMDFDSFNIEYKAIKRVSKSNPMPFNHQSVFVRREILLEYMFDLSYKISADYDLFYRIYISGEYNYLYVDSICAIYDSVEGVSSQNSIRVAMEKIRSNRVVSNYICLFNCYRNYYIKTLCKIFHLNKILLSVRKMYLKRIYKIQ